NNVLLDTDPQFNAFYGSGGALSTYSNKALDDLIDQGRTSTETKDRVAVYEKAFALLRDDAGGIGIIQYTLISASSTKVSWAPRPDGRIRAYDIGLRK
ncbi:MAG TPA: hypothetical protein DCL63_13085, partial [Firmicutes bacterium]|nr:hypothetical protein [Bacillota bacterium]